jgi:excisionase family DNA binding protein
MDPDRELLDIREAAEFLRVSETSLRRWTNAGQLPCLRIGGRRERRFRRADLLAFIGGTPARNHVCGFYINDEDRARGAAAFLGAGLQSEARCLVAADARGQRAIIGQLGQSHPAVRADLKVGRLVMVEYRKSVAAQLDYWQTQLRDARRAGVSRIYVVGDVSGGALGRLPFAQTLAYEAEYDRVIARMFPVTTLCQYDARTITGVDAAAVLQCHHGPLP